MDGISTYVTFTPLSRVSQFSNFLASPHYLQLCHASPSSMQAILVLTQIYSRQHLEYFHEQFLCWLDSNSTQFPCEQVIFAHGVY